MFNIHTSSEHYNCNSYHFFVHLRFQSQCAETGLFHEMAHIEVKGFKATIRRNEWLTDDITEDFLSELKDKFDGGIDIHV